MHPAALLSLLRLHPLPRITWLSMLHVDKPLVPAYSFVWLLQNSFMLDKVALQDSLHYKSVCLLSLVNNRMGSSVAVRAGALEYCTELCIKVGLAI